MSSRRGPRPIQTIACALLATLGSAGAGRAEVKQVLIRGDWGLYAGKDVSGTDVCVASTAGTQIYMGVKVYARQDHITIHFAKTGWSIPKDIKPRILFQFDRAAPWTGSGYNPGNDKVLETVIPLKSIASFANQFKSSSRLVIAFPDGNEKPWQISLRGSRFVMDAFSQCVTLLEANNKQTQPFEASPKDSQPFDNSQPTQPTPAQPAPAQPTPAEPKPELPQGTRI